MAGSETPVRGSFFNKIASLTAWRLLTVLERDGCTGISLRILRNFQEMFPCEICELFKNILFYITPPVAASEQTQEMSVVHLVFLVI